jgi:glycosyltransferase involved in cell wall biosynthesis
MRVLHVNHLLDPTLGGGTAERTFQLSLELASMGVDCTILTMDIGESYSRAVRIPRLAVQALPCINQRFFFPKGAFRRIEAIVKSVHIVQMFGNWTVLNFLVWRACRRLGKPYVFCPAGALPLFGRSLLLKGLYRHFITGALVRDAARCVCITDDERQHFGELSAEPSKLEIIPNGTDPEKYRLVDPAPAIAKFRASLGIGAEPFILFLGRLNSIKGPDLLLDAFCFVASKWPRHHLVLGGPDGGMLSQLRRTAVMKGLANRVHFPGFLDSGVKAAALHAAELLVIPSRSEAMSIVVLEAGACGTPVLFTDKCGLKTFEKRGVGTMVPVDAVAMAAALDRLLEEHSVTRLQGEQLKAIVMGEFLWSSQASRCAAMYQKILQESDSDRA